ncbi:MAG: pyridoxamine 5'-phosphate oxidase family protein [Planctomycetota bacterium]
MNLKRLFEDKNGFGVLSTSDGSGRVNSAVYARPHVFADDRVAFIMADRLTHENLKSNPHAAYLFRADPDGGGKRYEGVRLYLTCVEETNHPELISRQRRREYSDPEKTKFMVTFKVEKVLPLIGAEAEETAEQAEYA